MWIRWDQTRLIVLSGCPLKSKLIIIKNNVILKKGYLMLKLNNIFVKQTIYNYKIITINTTI